MIKTQKDKVIDLSKLSKTLDVLIARYHELVAENNRCHVAHMESLSETPYLFPPGITLANCEGILAIENYSLNQQYRLSTLNPVNKEELMAAQNDDTSADSLLKAGIKKQREMNRVLIDCNAHLAFWTIKIKKSKESKESAERNKKAQEQSSSSPPGFVLASQAVISAPAPATLPSSIFRPFPKKSAFMPVSQTATGGSSASASAVATSSSSEAAPSASQPQQRWSFKFGRQRAASGAAPLQSGDTTLTPGAP